MRTFFIYILLPQMMGWEKKKKEWDIECTKLLLVHDIQTVRGIYVVHTGKLHLYICTVHNWHWLCILFVVLYIYNFVLCVSARVELRCMINDVLLAILAMEIP